LAWRPAWSFCNWRKKRFVGVVRAALIAGELGEGVGAGGIQDKGAAEEVAFVRLVLGGLPGGRLEAVFLVDGFLTFAEVIGAGDIAEAGVEDLDFHDRKAAQAPLFGSQAHDEAVLDGVGGLEARPEILEQSEEVAGIFAGEQVLAGSHAVNEAIPAGVCLAFRGRRPGGSFRVPAVRIDLCFGSHCVLAFAAAGGLWLPAPDGAGRAVRAWPRLQFSLLVLGAGAG